MMPSGLDPFLDASNEWAKNLFNEIQHENKKEYQKEVLKTDLKKRIRDLNFFRARYFSHKWKNFTWYNAVDLAWQKHRFVIVLCPPGWGKTFGITIPAAIQQLCADRKNRVMLVSKSESKAKNFMSVISNELKFNKKLQDDFGGPFYGKGLQWNTEKIKIIGSEGDEATPSLSNEGIKGQMESARPTCIIMDDPIDKETAFSASAVYDFLETMEMTVLRRLEPGGKLLLIAHRYCKGDGFDGDGGLLNDFRFKDGAVVVPAMDSNGNSTCPERWPNSELDQLRFQEKTKFMWLAEFMQNPTSREGCPFNVNWILPPTAANRYQNANRWTDIRPPVLDMSIDPAYSDERKGDYSGIWVAGQHPLDKFGIINYCLKKMEISGKFSETYGDLFLMLNARRMFVEINNARTLGDAIREYLKPKGVSPTRIIDVSAKTGKVSRIGDLEPFFRNDPSMNLSAKQFRMYWHYNLLDIYKETGWDPFWNEYVNWNPLIDGHDHILDAGAQLMFEGYVMRTFYSGRIYSH